jgi:hypothetical protein
MKTETEIRECLTELMSSVEKMKGWTLTREEYNVLGKQLEQEHSALQAQIHMLHWVLGE